MQKKIKEKSADINKLFDKLVEEKNKGLKNFESARKKLIKNLDSKIDQLNKRKKLVTDYIILKKSNWNLKKVPVRKRIASNTLWMNLRYLVSMPFIYSMIIPAVLFHICLEIYHHVCFRLYGIPRVRAREYFVFERKHLPYLNWLEKINCAYCSYFNCLIAYAREIGGRTEKYWCPIKHEIQRKDAHNHYCEFVDYSDEKVLRKKWDQLRKFDDS